MGSHSCNIEKNNTNVTNTVASPSPPHITLVITETDKRIVQDQSLPRMSGQYNPFTIINELREKLSVAVVIVNGCVRF